MRTNLNSHKEFVNCKDYVIKYSAFTLRKTALISFVYCIEYM